MITAVSEYGANIYQTKIYCQVAKVFYVQIILMLVTIVHSHYLSIRNY